MCLLLGRRASACACSVQSTLGSSPAFSQAFSRKRRNMSHASRPPSLRGREVDMPSSPPTTPPSGPESEKILSMKARDLGASAVCGRSYRSISIILPILLGQRIKVCRCGVLGGIHCSMHGLVVTMVEFSSYHQYIFLGGIKDLPWPAPLKWLEIGISS